MIPEGNPTHQKENASCDELAGRDEPRTMHTTGPATRHPYSGGSIPQHNTSQHQDSTEPMLGKMGLPRRFLLGNGRGELLGAKAPAKIKEVTLMRPIHGNL